MKLSSPRRRRHAWLCALAVWLACTPLARTHAQSVLVLEGSERDRDAARKLEALSDRPVRRLAAPARDLSTAALRAHCRDTEVAYVVALDAREGSVEVLACPDGTPLMRRVPSAQDPPPAYESAFVASELLALSSELDAQRAVPAAPSVRLRLRAALEVLAWAGLYSGAWRPQLAVGVAYVPRASLELFAELGAAPFGAGRRDLGAGRLMLTRHDFQLRAGAGIRGARLGIELFALGASSLTHAEYLAQSKTSALRWALGSGIEVYGELAPFVRIGASFTLSAALGRNLFQFQTESLASDPPRFAQIAASVLFTPQL